MASGIAFNWSVRRSGGPAVRRSGDPAIRQSGVHRSDLSSNIRPVIWSNTQPNSNPRVDAMLEQARQEPSVEKRKALYVEVPSPVLRAFMSRTGLACGAHPWARTRHHI